MSNRLDKERELRLQPVRVSATKEILEDMGYIVAQCGEARLEFEHKGHKVLFYPYSGWHSGKSINDGRGFHKLIKQLSK